MKFKCYMCKKYKEEESFYKDKSRPTGLQSRCKPCNKKLLSKYERSEKGKIKQKIKTNLRRRLRHTIKGKDSNSKYIGCNREELKLYLESLFKPGMNWSNYGFGKGKWVIDHIRPISNFIKNGEDPRLANHYTNLQPLWFEENMLKSDKFGM